MRFYGFLFLFLTPFFTCAQSFVLSGRITDATGDKLLIADFYGSENRVIDSVSIDGNGAFSYRFKNNAQIGMYRLRWGGNRFMDIVFNNENITFTTHNNSIVDSLNFTESLENQLYFDYLKKRNDNEYKLELLHPLLGMYPIDDPFFEKIQTHYDKINQDLKTHVDNVTSRYPATFAAKLIKADFTPRPPASLPEEEHINYLRAKFFDNIDFSDSDLLYTGIIANKVIQYLSLYQNNRISKDQLEVEFIKAVNVIMNKTQINPEIYEFAMDYLINGFNSYGFDRVITYIADNINLDDQCFDSERKAELEKKVESLRKFAVGIKAPDFTAVDMSGKKVRLSETGAEYTLLVFWATWCPHCTGLVKELRQLYLPDNKDKLEIITVSLDESEEDLQSFLAGGGYDWINICDFKKWRGDVVQLYDIYATPTIFLLKNDLTIEAKPMNYNEVRNELFKRNVLK